LIQYFCTQQSPKIVVFINQLCLSGDLSCIAGPMAEMPEQNWEISQKAFYRFIQPIHCDFTQYWGTILLLSQTLASRVISAVEDFQYINYHSLYHSFMQTLGKILNNEPINRWRRKN